MKSPSSLQKGQRVRHIGRADEFEAGIIGLVEVAEAGPRDDGLFKADPLGLPQPLFQAGDTAHFPAQAHLADGDQLVADRLVQQRGDHAHADGQVAGGVPQGDAPDDIDIDVQVAKEIPGPALQYSQQTPGEYRVVLILPNETVVDLKEGENTMDLPEGTTWLAVAAAGSEGAFTVEW